MVVLEVFIRITAAVASLSLFYVAWFVYEDEEKVLQSKIEAWWLQFDDLRAEMVTRHVAFVVVIASRAKTTLDRILGQKTLSAQSVAAALFLSVASTSLIRVIGDLVMATAGKEPHRPATYMLIGAACLALGIAPAVSPRFGWIPKVAAPSAPAFLILSALVLIIPSAAPGTTRPLILAADTIIVASIGLTLFSLHFARRGLGIVAATRSEWKALPSILIALAPLFLLVIMALGFIVASIAIEHIYLIKYETVEFVSIIFISALSGAGIALCYALLILSIVCLMVLHRVVWPLLSRALYNVPRHHILESKKAIGGVGVALMSYAMGSGYLKQLLTGIGL